MSGLPDYGAARKPSEVQAMIAARARARRSFVIAQKVMWAVVDVCEVTDWIEMPVSGDHRPRPEPKHDETCAEWCNHCAVCGEGIRYGSRCREHYQNLTQGKPSDALDAVRRLKDAGLGMYTILAAVTNAYDMETKS